MVSSCVLRSLKAKTKSYLCISAALAEESRGNNGWLSEGMNEFFWKNLLDSSYVNWVGFTWIFYPLKNVAIGLKNSFKIKTYWCFIVFCFYFTVRKMKYNVILSFVAVLIGVFSPLWSIVIYTLDRTLSQISIGTN